MELKQIQQQLTEIRHAKKVIITDENLTFDLFKDFFLKCAKKYTDNYIVTAEIDKIIKSLYNYLRNGEQTKGIYIAGGTGSGKTTLLNIFFDLVDILNIKYIYGERILCMRPIRIKEIDINKEYMKRGESIYIERATIYIDDFGQNRSVNYMGNQINPIEEFLLSRFDDKPQTFTFFSSNYPISHPSIKEKYGERIFDRLQYFCYYCELKEVNFRQLKK